MVRIRLAVKGRKNNRSFSIIAIDQKMSRDSGRFLEVLGHYDPKNKDLKLERDKINKWINLGAQPSKTVLSLLNNN